MEDRFSFDKVAQLYDGVRPTYPDALFSDIHEFADLKPGDAVLEVGCGTGQGTRGIAARDLKILATDPGPDLIAVARKSLAEFSNIEFAISTFEALPPQPRKFNLLVAAQCWHWIAPDIRFSKAADFLMPGGTLAVFGNVPVGLSAPLLDAFERIFNEIAPGSWAPPPEIWYLQGGPVADLFDQSRVFAPVVHRGYPWMWRLKTAAYIDFLKTRSDLQRLSTSQKTALYRGVAAAIDAEGGKIDIQYEAHLYMARAARASES